VELLLALVYHSSTTPETQSGYRAIRLQLLHWPGVSRALSGRLCSKSGRASVRVRTYYLHSRGVDGVFSHLYDPFSSREPTIRVLFFLRHDS
jgi:hypothetical protein